MEDVPESWRRLVQGDDKSRALETLVSEVQESNDTTDMSDE
jgi:hypothetical protein